MIDNRRLRICNAYSTAIIDLAIEAGFERDLIKYCNHLQTLITHDLIDYLSDFELPNADQKAMVQLLVKNLQAPTYFHTWLLLIVERRQFIDIEVIIKLTLQSLYKKLDILEAIVYTTNSLSTAQAHDIKTALSAKYHKEIIVKNLINKELISGYEIQIAGQQISNNIKAWLQTFAHQTMKEI